MITEIEKKGNISAQVLMYVCTDEELTTTLTKEMITIIRRQKNKQRGLGQVQGGLGELRTEVLMMGYIYVYRTGASKQADKRRRPPGAKNPSTYK